MSSELVPRSYDLKSYNTLIGTELETHTDVLTTEQAARINDCYDIEIHVGTHGRTPSEQPSDHSALITLPTQLEYEEAAAVVERMQPGDTLFIEGYGFDSQPPQPVVVPDRLPDTLGESTQSSFRRMLGENVLALVRQMKSDALHNLEEARQGYKIRIIGQNVEVFATFCVEVFVIRLGLRQQPQSDCTNTVPRVSFGARRTCRGAA